MRLLHEWKTHKEAYAIKYSLVWRKYLQNAALSSDKRQGSGNPSHATVPMSEVPLCETIVANAFSEG